MDMYVHCSDCWMIVGARWFATLQSWLRTEAAARWGQGCWRKGAYDTPQHTATHCNTLLHIATHCNTLQHIATHCNTLQHTATHFTQLYGLSYYSWLATQTHTNECECAGGCVGEWLSVRERDKRQRERCVCVCVYIYIYVHLNIWIYEYMYICG